MSDEQINPVLTNLSNAIEKYGEVNGISNSELIVYLAYILRARIKANVKYTLSNLGYAGFALQINKKAKQALNDCIKEIDKKKNTLRSLEKDFRKKTYG